MLVALDEFTTWEAFETAQAFKKAAQGFGGAVTLLGDLLVDKVLGNRDEGGGFTDRVNAVFLPAIGISPAVTSRSALVIKPHNYIQLVLDPSRASAEYVARYLNTPLGHLTRRIVQTGAYIQRTTLVGVDSAPLILPSFDDQMRMVGLQRQVDELKAELEATERDLWRTRDLARSASRTLQTFPTGDNLDSWLPRLPYPLASVLWTYRVTLDPRRRTDILFAFFEATAEFLTTILLSGLRSNATVFEQLRDGPYPGSTEPLGGGRHSGSGSSAVPILRKRFAACCRQISERCALVSSTVPGRGSMRWQARTCSACWSALPNSATRGRGTVGSSLTLRRCNVLSDSKLS